MATYLQGVTDYIPQVQPFVPDYNFYAGVMNFKQSKYDAAKKQLSSIYGSLLNAPLTRDDNTEARDKFFKTIDQDIQKMAGTDLSLSQNSEAAEGIFNQLLDNKNIVKDMVWTKQFQNEQQRAQGFKDCVDPDKCGGAWWEGGERLLGYQRESFRNASADQAMKMNNASFVAYQDVTKRAMKLAKEADLNVSIDQNTGEWITTTKNGPLIVEPLTKLMQGSIGKDPKVMEYYQAKAELDRKDYMYTNQQQHGSLEAAEQAYIDQMTPLIDKMFSGYTEEVEDKINTTQLKKQKVIDVAQNTTPGKESDLEALLDEYDKVESGYSATLEDAKEVNGHMTIARANKKYSAFQIDRIMASANLSTDLGEAAKIMAYKDYTSKMTVNPYAMEAVQQKNRLVLEDVKTQNTLTTLKYKFDLDQYAKQLESQGTGEDNTPTQVVGIQGASDASNEDPNSTHTEYVKEREGIITDLSGNEKTIISEVMEKTRLAAESGDVTAQEDMVKMVQAFAASTSSVASKETQGDYGQTVNGPVDAHAIDLANAMGQAKTLKEKYNIAKRFNLNYDNYSGTQVDDVYNKTVYGFMNPSEKGNTIMRKHLQTTWEKTTDTRRNIYAKGEALQQMDKYYAEDAQNVIAKARTNSDYKKEDIDALASYIDPKGHVVDKLTFIKNMVAKGYDKSYAQSVYRGDVENPTGPDWIRENFNWMTQDFAEAIDVKMRSEMSEHRGVHDLWKETFSKYAEPKGASAWYQMTGGASSPGADSKQSIGMNYANVDPAKYRSVGTMGLTSYLKEAVADPSAVFTMGNFASSIPDNNVKAKEMAQTLLTDFYTMKKGDSRPIANVTYVNTAGGSNNKVAINFKVNEAYRKKYDGTAKDPGIMSEMPSEGITIYMDKDKAKNLFTQGSTKTAQDVAMEWGGKIDFDAYPEYTKNFNISIDKNSNSYKASGSVVTSINENGLPVWENIQADYPLTTDLNQLITTYDGYLAKSVAQVRGLENQWMLNNK